MEMKKATNIQIPISVCDFQGAVVWTEQIEGEMEEGKETPKKLASKESLGEENQVNNNK